MTDIQINVMFSDATNKQFQFADVKKLSKFLVKERDFWASKQGTSNGTSSRYTNAFHLFSPIISTLDAWSPNFETWDQASTQANINGLIEQNRSRFNQDWISSETLLATQLIDCQEKFGGQAAEAFIDYTIRKTIQNISDRNCFLGIMYAYEMESQNNEILKRRNSEKKSFQKLRDDLENSRDNLISTVDTFKSEIDEWKEQSRNDWSNWNEATSTKWSTWINTAEDQYNSSQSERHDQFESYMEQCNTKITDLENTFQEHLRLEKPAQYWKRSARKYGIQGGLWSLALLSLGLIGIIYFRDFFNSWLQGKELGIQLNTIQGIALYGSILAVYAFLIRILSRLTFSSFHLMRDAEEREQLTYLYLSLSKEHSVDETSRNIILQALFSRSETGLLTSESGPTMPGIHEIVKAAGK